MTHNDRSKIRPLTTVALILAMLLAILPATTVPAVAEVDPGTGALASTPVRLPAGEMTWHATDQTSIAGAGAPLELSPGFVLALDDPLLVLFDGNNQFARMQADEAAALAIPSRATPLAMIAGTPVPFMTIELLDSAVLDGAATITFEQDALTFNVDAGDYALSLWRWDVAKGIPDEVAERLAKLTIPPLVYVRSGQVEVSAANGEPPVRLDTGDWAVVAPDATLGNVPDAPAPVLLIATLDQPGNAPGGTSTGGQPGGAADHQTTGGAQMPAAEPTLAPIEIPTLAPTVVPTSEPASNGIPTLTPTVVPTSEPASTGPDTSQSQSQSGGTSTGCGNVIILCVEDPPLVLVPTEIGGVFDSSAPVTDASSTVLVICAAIPGDSDNDELSDACEAESGTDPNMRDTDLDSLGDGNEVNIYHTDPTKLDSDGDELDDGFELGFGTDPTIPDTDGDGLLDGWERNSYGTYPLEFDSDSDGLGDGDEVFVYETDPLLHDMDSDGLGDGDELLVYGSNPRDWDTDGDTLPDGEEANTAKTSPTRCDTDGDGQDDYTEYHHGGSPLDPNDTASDGVLEPDLLSLC